MENSTIIIQNDLTQEDKTLFIAYLEKRGFEIKVVDYRQKTTDNNQLWEDFEEGR